MKVLIVGGGSGGHIMPAIVVAEEILRQKPRARLEFWTDKKCYKSVVKITTSRKVGGNLPIKIKRICSGKFRRYAGWKVVDYFKNFKITIIDLIIKNIGGMFGFFVGTIQSFLRLIPKSKRPDVVFLKGGFVGLPVGIVAGWLKIPYVIHESDSTAGLANRILMKKAKKVTFGARLDENKENWEWVGIPVRSDFRKVNETKQRSLKELFGFRMSEPLVVVTGGSQGAESINQAMLTILPRLLKITSVGLIAGKKQYEQMVELKKYEVWKDAKLKTNFRMWEFNSNMAELLGAADVVASRAGATTIAELEVLGKAVILVPFERLPGAHQVKNAEKLRDTGAVEMILDGEMRKKPELLYKVIKELLEDKEKRRELAEKLHEEAKASAAKRLAEIIIEVGGKA